MKEKLIQIYSCDLEKVKSIVKSMEGPEDWLCLEVHTLKIEDEVFHPVHKKKTALIIPEHSSVICITNNFHRHDELLENCLKEGIPAKFVTVNFL